MLWLPQVMLVTGSTVAGGTASAHISTLVDIPIASGASPTYLDGTWELQHLTNATSGVGTGPVINATVPGDILSDLQRAGRLPDPYWNTSWREPAFIAAWNNGSWRYSKRFAAPPPAAAPATDEVLLCFDGVLMGATLQLDGQPLSVTTDPVLGNVTGATDQFLRYAFPVGSLLRRQRPSTGSSGAGNGGAGSHVVSATFGAALNEHPGTSGGRFTFSTAIDWAPRMLTHDRQGKSTFGFGLWKSVYLLPVPHGLAITHLVPSTFYAGGHPTSRLSDERHAGFVVNVTLELYATRPIAAAEVAVVGAWPDAQPVSRRVALTAGSNSVTLSVPADQTKAVQLWHPHGHGAQPLYNITATVSVLGDGVAASGEGSQSSATVITTTRRIGFRHVALVTINDTDAAEVAAAAAKQNTGAFTMMFRVNGAAVFARGGSMIPMDLLSGRLSAEAHHRLVQSAAEGNFNTLRIWGGGIYHPQSFYDACDEFGILLYHDLQFTGKAGSVTFSHVVEAEIKHNIRRLSHHPCVFLWDACNECKVFYPWWKAVLPTVATVDTSRPIWPASPSNGWVSGVERLTSRPVTRGRQIPNTHWRGPGVGGFPWPQESHGPYTGFMHEPVPGVNNWTMPHAQPAAVQAGGMGGANNPSAVPTRTGPGQEGWAKSE
jgi:beta-mannosidase